MPDDKLLLARTYARVGKAAQALALVVDASKSPPNNPEPLLVKGAVLVGQRDGRGAIEAYGAALKLKPDIAGAHRGMGQSYETLKDPARAMEHYRKALALDPKDAASLNNLAWILSEDPKKLDEALPLATRAVEIAPGIAAIVDTLGWIHYRRGAYADAEKALLRAVEREPRNATFQYHLGMTYYRLGKRSDAASALKRAAQLDPELASREKVDDVLRALGS